jgi:hypothetical protein
LYAGAGYGYRSQLIHATTSSSHPIFGGITESKVFFYGRYNSVEIDWGLLLRAKFLTFTAGASCLPMREGGGKPYYELHFGMGFAF